MTSTLNESKCLKGGNLIPMDHPDIKNVQKKQCNKKRGKQYREIKTLTNQIIIVCMMRGYVTDRTEQKIINSNGRVIYN